MFRPNKKAEAKYRFGSNRAFRKQTLPVEPTPTTESSTRKGQIGYHVLLKTLSDIWSAPVDINFDVLDPAKVCWIL